MALNLDIFTLFPEMFTAPFAESIIRRAIDAGKVHIDVYDLRTWTHDRHRTADDRPYGGGPGMVMLAQPLEQTLAHIRAQRHDTAPVVLFSPIGQRLDHAQVQRWSAGSGAILLCGRYEGIDQRFIDTQVNQQISLGDFVLSGGEVPAMALLDAQDASTAWTRRVIERAEALSKLVPAEQVDFFRRHGFELG